MSRWMTMALVAGLAACAGVKTVGQRDASGQWIGEIDRGGQRQAVSLDLQREGGSYRGQLRPIGESAEAQQRGDEVRFETEELRFVGHVEGSRLSGTVTDKRADAPAGELSAIHAEEPTLYSAGSEWSIGTAGL